MDKNTISAILVWVAIALLILNAYFRSMLLFLTCIAMVIIAVIVYFTPRLRKRLVHASVLFCYLVFFMSA